MDNHLVDRDYILEKMPGKGGWTFVVIPEIIQDKKAPFGWVRVKGRIDTFEISKYNLMPLGNGRLFLPVRAEIRKKINKKEGDTVRVVLYEDQSPTEIPEELIECLQSEPEAYDKFRNLPQSEQKYFLDWIYAAKKEETKIERIVKTIEKVLNGEKFFAVKRTKV